MSENPQPIEQFVTGFAGVPFGILADEGAGTLPDFGRERTWAVHRVAGSTTTYRQLTHTGPHAVTYRVWLDSLDDARALEALVGTIGRLTLDDGVTILAGTHEYIHGEAYLHLDNVLLVDARPDVIDPDGSSEWFVTVEVTT